MTPVLIRADATPAMGTGHVMRCLALAEALEEEGAAPFFAAAAITDALADRVRASGHDLHCIAAEPGSPGDLAATLDLARYQGARAAILDGYQFDAGWRAGLAAGLRPVLAFDDMARAAPLHADLVVNANPAAPHMGYERLAPGAVLLLGPAHVQLRRELRTAMAAPRPPLEERRHILMTFGGSDPLGLTIPVLKRLAPSLDAGLVLDVVAGGSHPNLPCVRAAAARFPDRVRLHVDTDRMGLLMAGAGLAVSAGGGTLGELAALAVPTLLAVVADNQEPAAQAAEKDGWVRLTDGRRQDAPDLIARAALDLWRDPDRRRAMSARIDGLVDGLGTVRIARALLSRAALP